MPDAGLPVRFGWFLVPDAADPQGLIRDARLAEQTGFDLIGIQDHPYQRRYLDTFSLLAALATATERIRLFPDVACLPLRHPAMLAKAAASIDLLSDGRFELGLGAGAFWDAIVAMGGPRRAPGEAVDALEEAIALLRLLWSDQRSVRFTGQHYRVAGVKPGPAPAHPMGIWVGAFGPRMLALIGRVADGWVPSSTYVTPDRLPAAQARIDDAAAAAGREPAAIRRLYNISGRIGPGGGGFLDGPASQWVEQLLPLVTEVGMDTFSLLAALATATERVRLFPDVACLPLRHPAMLAKASTSIDLLSDGRFELGLGAGAFWDAIAAMGGPRRAPGEAVEALEEAIALLRPLWVGGSGAQAAEGDSPRPQGPRSVRFTGQHYRVAGVKPGPAPAHAIGIWVGAFGPRMLGLIGRVADGWVPSSTYATPERLPAAQARVDDAAAAAGRDPAAIRRLYNINGRIGPGGGGFLDGPAGQWVEQLLPLVTEVGMDTFVLWPAEDPARQVRLFADEVAPALREAVAAHRGRG